MVKFEAVESETDATVELAQELFREYAAELGNVACNADMEQEIVGLPGRYAPPDGCLLLLTFRGMAAACGAYRRAADGSCELKRIYVMPDLRGMGFGRIVTEELLRRALAAGYRRATLDTLTTMHSAQELYKSLAFMETHRVPAEKGPGIVYMERLL
jgi:ribosomal protein S18 acetylase RimI-like enzyme